MQHGLPEQAIEPTASRTGANKLGYRAVKRAFDLTATAMAIIVLSPLFLILSVIVYLGDPGAVIYGQVRIGKNGKPFKMWKFRSMYRNADQMIDQLSEEQKRQYHTEFKIDNDPRITPVGNFLRKTSLDELPQLFNVLAGDMSFIGPRPLIPEESHIRELRREYGVYSVRPGLTGWAEEKAEYDREYIERRSLLFDTKIFFRTIWVVLTGKDVVEGGMNHKEEK